MNTGMRYNFGKKSENSNDLYKNTIAYYTFDETIGDLIDYKNGYNGIKYGGIQQGLPGKLNKAYEFNGTNGYIVVDNNEDFSFVDDNGDLPFTIRTIFKLNQIPSGGDYNGIWLVSKREINIIKREWQLYYLNNKLGIGLLEHDKALGNNNLSASIDNVNLNLNTWYHLTATYDGSHTKEGLKVYLNGINMTNYYKGDNTLYKGMEKTTSRIYFGKAGEWQDFMLNGYLDDTIIIKNKCFSDSEVLKDYQNNI